LLSVARINWWYADCKNHVGEKLLCQGFANADLGKGQVYGNNNSYSWLTATGTPLKRAGYQVVPGLDFISKKSFPVRFFDPVAAEAKHLELMVFDSLYDRKKPAASLGALYGNLAIVH